MRLTINRQTFVRAAACAQGAMPRMATKPALSYVHVSPESGALVLTGCDLETYVQTRAPLAADQIDPSGDGERCLLLSGRAIKMLGYDDSDVVQIQWASHGMSIKGDRLSYEEATAPAKEYPLPPAPGDATWQASVPGGVLVGAIRRTKAATDAAATHNRLQLNTVALLGIGGAPCLAATNGYRAAIQQLPGDTSPAKPALIPLFSVDKVAVLLASAETVQVQVEQDVVRFAGEATTVIARLYEGRCAPYERGCPPKNAHVGVEIPAGELLRHIRAIEAANVDGKSVVVEFGAEKLALFLPESSSVRVRNEMLVASPLDRQRKGVFAHHLIPLLSSLDADEILTLSPAGEYGGLHLSTDNGWRAGTAGVAKEAIK